MASDAHVKDLFPAIGAEKIVEERLASLEPESDEAIFWSEYIERYLSPSIISLIPHVFRYPDQPAIYDSVYAYGSKREDVKESESFALLERYDALKRHASAGKVREIIADFGVFATDPQTAKTLAAYIRKNVCDAGLVTDPASSVTVTAMINLLSAGSYDFASVYEGLKQPPETAEEEPAPAPAAPAPKKKAQKKLFSSIRTSPYTAGSSGPAGPGGLYGRPAR